MPYAYDNTKIITWARDTNLGAIKAEISALGITHSPNSPNKTALASAVTVNVRQRNGLADKISYRMPRSGVFLHKGVGRGTPIGRAGQTARKAKRWFDNPTNRNLPELQAIIAENDATYIINNLTIK